MIDATNPINREMIALGINAFVENILENGITGLPSNIVETIDKSSGNIQKLKGTPIYNSLKAIGVAADVVWIGNVIYTDIEQFEGSDVTVAIVYDVAGSIMGTIGGAAGGAVTGSFTGNPLVIGAGTIAGAAVGNAIGSRWADQRKESLKKIGVNNNEK